jgi:hypothetical protein
MTPEEILEVDAKRNHPPGTTVEDLITNINDELREGGDIVQEGNVLIVYRAIKPGVVEHHSFNADTPENLLKANEALWRMLKKVGVEIATTTYSNPKINNLLDTVRDEFDISITEQDGQFVAEVRL